MSEICASCHKPISQIKLVDLHNGLVWCLRCGWINSNEYKEFYANAAALSQAREENKIVNAELDKLTAEITSWIKDRDSWIERYKRSQEEIRILEELSDRLHMYGCSCSHSGSCDWKIAYEALERIGGDKP